MIELIKDILDYLLENYTLYVCVALVVSMTGIFFVLQLLKKPIKLLTAKITNEVVRHLANKSIVLLSFGLSAIAWIILSLIAPNYFKVDFVTILLDGAFPIVFYALGDGVITTKKAKQITNKVKDITKDGKVTKDEIKGIIDEEIKQSAEEQLDKLLK